MLTITTTSPKQQGYGRFFCFSTAFTEARSNYQILSTPGSGVSYYLTDLVLSPGSQAGSFTFTEAPLTVTTNVIDEIRVAANTMQSVGFKTPIVMSAGATLRISIDTNSGATRTVIISGYKL